MMASSVNWPPRLNLAYLPTPLQLLERLSERLGGPRIWVKRDDLTGSTLSGNKVRKLEFTLAHAINQQHDVLITCGGLQSNHCRATAFAGAQLGIPVHLILRGDLEKLDGNVLLDHLAGAKITTYPTKQYQTNLTNILNATANDYQARGYKPYIIPTGASDAMGVWGYFSACQELKQDFREHKIQPELIVVATGSGGTQAGLTLGSEFFKLRVNVLGMAVCDDRAYFQQKVEEDITGFRDQFESLFVESFPSEYSINTNDQYIGEGYGVACDSLLETIALLAREEGILLDPVYSGKAFHGLIQEIKQGNLSGMSDVVFIHTGGSFGLFPYRQQLQSVISKEFA